LLCDVAFGPPCILYTKKNYQAVLMWNMYTHSRLVIFVYNKLGKTPLWHSCIL